MNVTMAEATGRVKDQELGMEGRGRGWATAVTSGNHWKERGWQRERDKM